MAEFFEPEIGDGLQHFTLARNRVGRMTSKADRRSVVTMSSFSSSMA